MPGTAAPLKFFAKSYSEGIMAEVIDVRRDGDELVVTLEERVPVGEVREGKRLKKAKLKDALGKRLRKDGSGGRGNSGGNPRGG